MTPGEEKEEGEQEGVVDGRHTTGASACPARAHAWSVLRSTGQVETRHPQHPPHKGAPFGWRSVFYVPAHVSQDLEEVPQTHCLRC